MRRFAVPGQTCHAGWTALRPDYERQLVLASEANGETFSVINRLPRICVEQRSFDNHRAVFPCFAETLLRLSHRKPMNFFV